MFFILDGSGRREYSLNGIGRNCYPEYLFSDLIIDAATELRYDQSCIGVPEGLVPVGFWNIVMEHVHSDLHSIKETSDGFSRPLLEVGYGCHCPSGGIFRTESE